MNQKNLASIATAAAASTLIVLIALRVQGSHPIAVNSPLGVMTLLVGITAFWFWVERSTGWKLFGFVPPLLFIYATPIFLSNTGVLPFSSAAYDGLRAYGLPLFIALMLIKVDVAGALRVMGKGVFVMLIGSIGVVVGGVAAYAIGTATGVVDPSVWPAFGTLSGSWIGGTGNMNAAWAALEGEPQHMTMAAIADVLVYIVWLPLLLGSRAFADAFNRWAKVSDDRIERMERAALATDDEERAPDMVQILYLALLGLTTTAVSVWLAARLPELALGGQVVVSESTWVILLVTTIALLLSTTRARDLPGAQPIAMAIIYVFVASVGARANIANADLGQVGWFVVAAYFWIFIHGAFILAGAKLFRVDVHTLAIASAANVGGAASAPVVAAYHRPSLVPASILMALIGYAVGNYLAILTGRLAQLIAT